MDRFDVVRCWDELDFRPGAPFVASLGASPDSPDSAAKAWLGLGGDVQINGQQPSVKTEVNGT